MLPYAKAHFSSSTGNSGFSSANEKIFRLLLKISVERNNLISLLTIYKTLQCRVTIKKKAMPNPILPGCLLISGSTTNLEVL